ncbi:hypothetical protein OESDEN_14476 [Oesophagostomum dentatum]|uniref:Integrase catalytic domain-containing protein n=1 Tax=Oesophagostomum dentatum TaxID=61180 RepID=A0A0B1SLH3_OESDE|nr:hypothetical protein OESDEN_14476 [Oesophagostomum dentatum]
MTTRALHLETVLDNSAEEFVLALRRFIARRGTPNLITSDNAPTFKLGAEILQNQLLQIHKESPVNSFLLRERIKWKFITPLSPWQGGFYERLVGSVKNALKKTVQKAVLTRRTLETLIPEIEAALNTRPLTPLIDPSEDKEIKILRPIDLLHPWMNVSPFLYTENSTTAKCTSFGNSETKEHVNSLFQSIVETLNLFWKIWQKDYLQALIEKYQQSKIYKFGTASSPKIGHVVLLKQELSPRTEWPLGVITKINRSKDGLIRSVKVRTSNKSEIDRTVNQLIPLEIFAEDEPRTRKNQRRSPERIQPARAAKTSKTNQN